MAAEQATENANRDPRVYMAAERTFLAWIRTSLALMAFGFVIARFALFLREIEATHAEVATDPSALSLPIGVAFVLIGVLTNILASVHHLRYIREWNEGRPAIARPSRLAIVLALTLAAAGVGMAIYLGATNEHRPSATHSLEQRTP